MTAPVSPTIYRDGDYEWNATVTVLDHLDERGACGFAPGDLRALIDPERRFIAWPLIDEAFRVASTGERVLLDVARSLWTGRSMWTFEDEEFGEDGERPLAPLSDLMRVDSEAFELVLDAVRVRRGRF